MQSEAKIQTLPSDQLLLSQYLPRDGSEVQVKPHLFIEHKEFNHHRNSQHFVITNSIFVKLSYANQNRSLSDKLWRILKQNFCGTFPGIKLRATTELHPQPLGCGFIFSLIFNLVVEKHLNK